MNIDIIIEMAGAVKKHINRIIKKCPADLQTFIQDIDSQDILLFNIQMAVQQCIDLSFHIIHSKRLGRPRSDNQILCLLERNGYFNKDITEKMVKAAEFLNLILYEYEDIDLEQIFEFAKNDIIYIEKFLKAIFIKIGLNYE